MARTTAPLLNCGGVPAMVSMLTELAVWSAERRGGANSVIEAVLDGLEGTRALLLLWLCICMSSAGTLGSRCNAPPAREERNGPAGDPAILLPDRRAEKGSPRMAECCEATVCWRPAVSTMTVAGRRGEVTGEAFETTLTMRLVEDPDGALSRITLACRRAVVGEDLGTDGSLAALLTPRLIRGPGVVVGEIML